MTPSFQFGRSRQLDCARIYIRLVGSLRDGADHLRVLIADEREGRLALVAQVVAALGNGVIARETDCAISRAPPIATYRSRLNVRHRHEGIMRPPMPQHAPSGLRWRLHEASEMA
jgi:hypothetical protein